MKIAGTWVIWIRIGPPKPLSSFQLCMGLAFSYIKLS